MDELSDFASALAEALELEGVEVDVSGVLALASDAAHAYVRPAAPVATFLAGLAAGRSELSTASMESALLQARDFCARPPENLG